MTNSDLQSAIELIKHGNKLEGEKELQEILSKDPEIEKAWLWLTICKTDINDKINCLNQALRINPNNNNAQHEKEILLQKLENEQKINNKPTGFSEFEENSKMDPQISQESNKFHNLRDNNRLPKWEFLAIYVYVDLDLQIYTKVGNEIISGMDVDDYINSLGQQGWDLVTVVERIGNQPIPKGNGMATAGAVFGAMMMGQPTSTVQSTTYRPTTLGYFYHFKREILPNTSPPLPTNQ